MRIKIASMEILLLACTLISCTRKDCCISKNNVVLNMHTYSSPVYQAELFRLIQKHKEADYYFETQEEIGG